MLFFDFWNIKLHILSHLFFEFCLVQTETYFFMSLVQMLLFRYMIFKNARLWCNGICKMRNCGLTVYEKCGIAGYRYIYKVCDCGLIRVLILYQVLQHCLTMKQRQTIQTCHFKFIDFYLQLATFTQTSFVYKYYVFHGTSKHKKIKIILYIRYKCISSRSLCA